MYEEAQDPKSEFYWSDEHAIEPCAFLETLVHIKGVFAKQPFILEPWQIWIVIAIYGFRWRDTGFRVVYLVQLEITRKSGKSLLAAGLGLYELGPNADLGDDLYIIAPTAALGKKVLDPMAKIIDYKLELKEFYGIATFNERIDVAETDSYAIILSSAGKKQDGHDPKVVIADERHSLPAAIYNVMRSSQGARPESLFLEIGSAGYNAFGVGWDERQVAIEVLEGKRSMPELFVAIFTIDPEDFGNWSDQRVIEKANPNFGISLDKRKIINEVKSISTNPRMKAEVLRTRFNVWGLGEHKLIGKDAWDGCEHPEINIDIFDGQTCWGAADLASRNDMIVKLLLFELDPYIIPFARFYVPIDGVWREDEEVRDLYEAWIDEGFLIATKGSFHTYDQILEDVVKDFERFDIENFSVDDREANFLMGALAKKGHPVRSFRKNAANFSDPTKDIQARATGKIKGIAHDGHPVLAWNVENVIGATNTADLLLPKKVTQDSNMKIDGFDAMVQANAGRLNIEDDDDETPPQPMAERGMRVLN